MLSLLLPSSYGNAKKQMISCFKSIRTFSTIFFYISALLFCLLVHILRNAANRISNTRALPAMINCLQLSSTITSMWRWKRSSKLSQTFSFKFTHASILAKRFSYCSSYCSFISERSLLLDTICLQWRRLAESGH